MDREIENELFERFKKLKITEKEKSDIVDEIEPDTIYVFVIFDYNYAIIKIDKNDRLIDFYDKKTFTINFLFFDRWICKNVKRLFPNRNIIDAFPFKIVKEHILSYNLRDDESVEDFLEYRYKIKSSKIIMMEVDATGYSETIMFLASLLRLDSVSVYRFDMPLDMTSLMKVYIMGDESLKYPKVVGFIPEIFNDKGLLNILNSRDIILHHPYDSFDIVIKFIRDGVNDDNVLDIYHVVYRIDSESEILELLIDAAKKGKKCLCRG